MKTSVKWTDGVSFLGKSESGHSVSLDGPSELGGKNSGMRPMEMMLISIGGCTSFDVVTILKKSRQNIPTSSIIFQAFPPFTILRQKRACSDTNLNRIKCMTLLFPFS